ncbi:MAG: hypothetical protein V2A53_00920 [bacterium]
MKKMFLGVVLGMVLGLCVYAEGIVPQMISHQGRLTDASGATVPDGNYAIQTSIYDAPSGGNLLWQENQTIFISNGIFSQMLGSVTPINLPFDRNY